MCLILHIIYIRSLLFPFFKFNRWFPRTLRVRGIPFHIYSYIFHSRLSGSYIYVSSPIGIYIWIPICFYLNCPCSIWIHIQIRASRLLEYIYLYILPPIFYILHIMQSLELNCTPSWYFAIWGSLMSKTTRSRRALKDYALLFAYQEGM